MHNRSKLRRPEALPAEAQFAPSRVFESPPTPLKGNLGSKTASEIPIKELIDEEMSKSKGTRHPSPSLIARLMGVDSFPSLSKQKKYMDHSGQKTSSKGLLVNYQHTEGYSQWRNNEKQDFKDVFEVETSKSHRNANHSDAKGKFRCRRYEDDLNIARTKFMDTKCLSPSEVLQNSMEFGGAFEAADSTKDLFLELLQDPNSLFAKHLNGLKHGRPPPLVSKITILKPCKAAEHLSNKRRWSSRTERNNVSSSHMPQQVSISKNRTERLNKCCVEENTASISYNSLASEIPARPARIVILKPSREEDQNMAQTSFLVHDNIRYSANKDRKFPTSRFMELHAQGRNMAKLSHHTEDLIHTLYGAEENAREIARKMRHKISSLDKRNCKSELYMYPGIRDSFIMPTTPKLIKTEAISQPSNSFGECSDSFSTTSSQSTESYACRVGLNHSSARCNIIHQFHSMRHIYQGSSVPDEVIVADEATPQCTLDMLNNVNNLNEKLSSEVLFTKDCDFGIRRKDAQRDGGARFSQRNKTFYTSCNQKLPHSKRDDWCDINMINNVLDIGSPVSSDAKFCLPIPRVRTSDHQNCKFQLANSVGEEDMLLDREIEVNSEGLSRRIHVKNDTNLFSVPVDHKRGEVINSGLIPTFGDEIRHLTTQEVQGIQSAVHVLSENEGLFGRFQNDIVFQETASEHSQVKLLPSESDVAKSLSFRSLDLEQPSPESVLEIPSEDKYSSSCFERLSADIKELRMQLQLLKLESAASYVEENEVLMLDGEHYSCNSNLLPTEEVQVFRDDDDRDFTYLLDILVESGIHGIDDDEILSESHRLVYPVDQNIFSILEKKYDRVASWSRSERKLLFDLINCTLVDLVNLHMDVHTTLTSKTCKATFGRENLVEALWQMVAKQRKDLQCDLENKIQEPGWFGFKYDVDLVGQEMERMIHADLLEELVTEWLSFSYGHNCRRMLLP